MTDIKILIVGGGLAGLATAIASRRAGHRVEIIERAPAFHPSGGGIQLAPNGSTAVRSLGVLDKVQPYTTKPGSTLVRTYARGEVLLELPMGSAVEQTYGLPYSVVHRANLHRVLLDEARALEVNIRYGCIIKTIKTFLDKAELHLEDGTVLSGSLIVGADGERSQCRELILGRPDPLLSSGDVVYRLAVKLAELYPTSRETAAILELATSFNINYWMGPAAHAVSYMLSSDRILNIALTKAQAECEPTTYGVQECQKTELEAYLSEWDPRLRDALRAAHQVHKWTLLQASCPSCWSDDYGRMILVGDAAHAMLPYLAQGASQALEDAVTFGSLLSEVEANSDLPRMLQTYERIRKDRVETVRMQSQAMRDVFGLDDGKQQRIRDRKIRQGSMPGSPILLADPIFQKWLWGHDASKVVTG